MGFMRVIQQKKYMKGLLVKSKIGLIISFGIYGLGLLAYLLSDLYITKYYEADIIADWAFYKSFFPLIGALCIMGLDQALIRYPQYVNAISISFISRMTVLAVVSVLVVGFFRDYQLTNIFILIFIVMAYTALLYNAGAQRAHRKFWQAQIAINSWKILLLFLVIYLSNYPVYTWYGMSLLASLVVIILIKGFKYPEQKKIEESSVSKEIYNVGFYFFIHNIVFVFSIYGEQFLINIYGSKDVSAYLFSHYVVFASVANSLLGFVGFILMPKIKQMHNFNLAIYKQWLIRFVLIGFVLSVISFLSGLLIIKYIFASWNYYSDAGELDYLIIIFICMVCWVRYIYSLPSSTMGAYANEKKLKITAIYNWALIIIYMLVFMLILSQSTGADAARLISIATFCGWMVRLFISNLYSKRALMEVK